MADLEDIIREPDAGATSVNDELAARLAPSEEPA